MEKNDKGLCIMVEENLTKTAEREDDTINLVEVFKILRARIFIIITFLVLGALIGFTVATFTYTPEYMSSAVFMVDASSESGGNASTDLNNSKNIVANIVKVGNQNKFRKFILDEIRGNYEEFGIDVNEKNLEEWIVFVTNSSTSSITSDSSITVEITTPHAGLSFEIAAIVNANFENYIKENYKITETTNIAISSIAYPEQAEEPVKSSSRVTYALIGGVALALVYCVIAVIIALNDSRIKDESTIEREFGIPLLGILPQFPEESDGAPKK